MADINEPAPDLDCGLTHDAFNELRDTTALGRINHTEGKAIFDKLYANGFKVVPRESIGVGRFT